MPEAVIVATARSAIGRAFKGSLKDLRADDLTTTIVRAALDRVPELDPVEIDDLMLGCGLPGGEQGNNLGRVVAVQLGYDHLPGTTVTRYCASSLQTSRMAMHAIRSGEGHAFISAGVEMVSRYAKGSSDSLPDTRNPVFAEGAAAHRGTRAVRCAALARPPDRRRIARRLHGDGPDRRERRAASGMSPAEEMDEFAVRSQNRDEKAAANGFWAREITPVTLPDGTVIDHDDGPRPGTTAEALAGLDAGVPARRTGDRRQRCPLNDGAAAVVIMSDTRAAELGLTPLARIVATGVSALSPEIMGLGPVEATRQALRARRHEHRRHRPGRDQRGVRRAGHPARTGSWASTWTSSTSTAARSPSATRSA